MEYENDLQEELDVEDDFRLDICVETSPATIKCTEEELNHVKILSNWNFKGGVGKTTSTFGLAYALVHSFQKRVLMVDADPQKNLTQLVARYYFNKYRDFPDKFATISKSLDENERGFYFAMNKTAKDGRVHCAQIVKIGIEDSGTLTEQYLSAPKGAANEKNGLFLLSGSYKTALIEPWLMEGYNFDPHTPLAAHIAPYPAMFWNMIRKTAAANKIDYVIVDLSPAISALNMNILFSSHAYILPCAPDFFSLEALRSFPFLLNEGRYWEKHYTWRREYTKWRTENTSRAEYCNYPIHDVQFAGVIFTRYAYHNVERTPTGYIYHPISEEVRNYFRQLREIVSELITDGSGLCLPTPMLEKMIELEWHKDSAVEGQFRPLLACLPELHKLAFISQNASIPAAYLPNRLLNRNKCNQETYKTLRWCHRQSLEKIIHRIIHIIFNIDIAVGIDLNPTPPPETKKDAASPAKKRKVNHGGISANAVEVDLESEEDDEMNLVHSEED